MYTGFRSWSSGARSAEWSKSPYTPIGWHNITIIYPKRLANPIIFLLNGDNPGPLGNVRRAVLVQVLCQRPSINRHARSARGVRIWDLSSRALCPRRTSTRFRFTREAFRVRLRELESSFRRTLPCQRDIRMYVCTYYSHYMFEQIGTSFTLGSYWDSLACQTSF